MAGLSLKKEAREAQRKAKAQRKQEKRNARKQGTADKDIPKPGATEINLAVADIGRHDA